MQEEIIKKLIQYIDGTKDFLLEQSPEIFKQLVLYGRIKSLMLMLMFPIFIVVSIFIYRKINKSTDGSNSWAYDNENECIFLGIIGVILFMVLGIFFVCGLDHFVSSWFAPKIYILKYLMGR